MEEGAEIPQEAKKMLYIIAKKPGSRRELKKIQNICGNSSKKSCDYSCDSSSDSSDSNSSLARYSSWDIYIHPDRCKKMNELDHVGTNTLKTTKDQTIEAINNE